MDVKYLIRLDDACPTMDAKKWGIIEDILDKYKVRPLVGVVPKNSDIELKVDAPDSNFWRKVKSWEDKGWAIALHGYDHCYISESSGINPFWRRSEFAGVPLDIQMKKISQGIKIFRDHGVNPKYFFAPSHTFDDNTIEALRICSDIRIISDTVALKPYKKKDFVYIPQVIGHCMRIRIPGIWTFCLHPNIMNSGNFKSTEQFIKSNHKRFISFDDLELKNISEKSLFDMFLSQGFFSLRRLLNRI